MQMNKLMPSRRNNSLQWALQRSDALRSAYATRAGILFAVLASIFAGLILLLREDTLSDLTTNKYLAYPFWFLLLLLLYTAGMTIWHALLACVATFGSNRDNVVYTNSRERTNGCGERFLLNPTDSCAADDMKSTIFHDIFRALRPSHLKKVCGPQQAFKDKSKCVSREQRIEALQCELWFDLAIQHRRYERLGLAVTAVSLAFILWLALFLLVVGARFLPGGHYEDQQLRKRPAQTLTKDKGSDKTNATIQEGQQAQPLKKDKRKDKDSPTNACSRPRTSAADAVVRREE
jgi:hypothetical protein